MKDEINRREFLKECITGKVLLKGLVKIIKESETYSSFKFPDYVRDDVPYYRSNNKNNY